MKKILFYIDSLRAGGAQRVMSVLVSFFADSGYEVILVNDYLDKDESTIRYSIPASVKFYALRKELFGNVVIKNIQRIKKLREIVKNESPDIVLSFLGKPNKRMLISTIGLKTKKIVSVRNEPTHEYGKGIINRILVNQLFHLADGIVFQTKEAEKYFDKVNRAKSKTIFNPVNHRFYSVRRDSISRNIVTFGRLETQKNHEVLIRAFAQIKDKIPKDDLYIYGEGPLRFELEKLAAEVAPGRIFFPGIIKDVENKLASAKLFVLSSDFEGLPNSLMEAMAVGLPCISTDCPCGGPKELMNKANYGILIKIGDIDGLAKNIEKVINDEPLMRSLSEGASNRAKEFETERICKIWEAFFLDVCGDE